MARLAGVNLPPLKNMEIALTAVYGIGRARSLKILKEAEIEANKKAKDLTTAEENKLRKIFSQFKLEGDLRREIQLNVRRLRDINSYRGSRHTRHLPARGQSSRRNSRTVRGNVRITMGSGRRAASEKT